ncbi:MAG: peptidoglycan DD-metalloendopeptidase family protein [Deltaproteobacteria bacterium]|nr:peptidoglycan DD-metalloendopeptidase family protein [Deltaproteobacteria bacterium]
MVYKKLNIPVFFIIIFYYILLMPLMPFASTPNRSFGDEHGQIRKIETKLVGERKKLEEFNLQEKELLARLSELEEEVAKKRRIAETMRLKIRHSGREIKKLENRLDSLEISLKKVEIDASKRLVVLYKYAKKGYIKIVSDVNDLAHLLRRLVYVKAIMEEDRSMLARLNEKGLKYKKEILSVKKRLCIEERNLNGENKCLSSIEKTLEKKVIRLMDIHQEKVFYETAVNELQFAAYDIRQTIIDIEKRDTSKINQTSHFVDFKGNLPFPIEGKIIQPDKVPGYSRPKITKGIFFESSSDTKVKAVFPGRVDFSGKIKGYGEVVIINHGSRYFTISAHLFQRKKMKGEFVDGEDVIGTVGCDIYSMNDMLYFEMRRAGKILDPLNWFKAY